MIRLSGVLLVADDFYGLLSQFLQEIAVVIDAGQAIEPRLFLHLCMTDCVVESQSDMLRQAGEKFHIRAVECIWLVGAKRDNPSDIGRGEWNTHPGKTCFFLANDQKCPRPPIPLPCGDPAEIIPFDF